jgi:thiopurine S-methyltransferase
MPRDERTVGEAGWHLDTVHPQLLKHAEALLPTGDGDGACGCRVWVPLCGKSVDMRLLAISGHRVFGVELSGVAIDQLFDDFQLPRTTWQPAAPRGVHRVHTCGNIGVVEVHASPYLRRGGWALLSCESSVE